MLTDGSGEESIKNFLVLDDDDRVTEGRCRGILKIGAYVVASCNIEICRVEDVIDTNVEVKVSYNWDSAGDRVAPAGKVDRVWMDARSNVEDEELET